MSQHPQGGVLLSREGQVKPVPAGAGCFRVQGSRFRIQDLWGLGFKLKVVQG